LLAETTRGPGNNPDFVRLFHSFVRFGGNF
jgi:hypothetical protein